MSYQDIRTRLGGDRFSIFADECRSGRRSTYCVPAIVYPGKVVISRASFDKKVNKPNEILGHVYVPIEVVEDLDKYIAEETFKMNLVKAGDTLPNEIYYFRPQDMVWPGGTLNVSILFETLVSPTRTVEYCAPLQHSHTQEQRGKGSWDTATTSWYWPSNNESVPKTGYRGPNRLALYTNNLSFNNNPNYKPLTTLPTANKPEEVKAETPPTIFVPIEKIEKGKTYFFARRDIARPSSGRYPSLPWGALVATEQVGEHDSPVRVMPGYEANERAQILNTLWPALNGDRELPKCDTDKRVILDRCAPWDIEPTKTVEPIPVKEEEVKETNDDLVPVGAMVKEQLYYFNVEDLARPGGPPSYNPSLPLSVKVSKVKTDKYFCEICARLDNTGEILPSVWSQFNAKELPYCADGDRVTLFSYYGRVQLSELIAARDEAAKLVDVKDVPVGATFYFREEDVTKPQKYYLCGLVWGTKVSLERTGDFQFACKQHEVTTAGTDRYSPCTLSRNDFHKFNSSDWVKGFNKQLGDRAVFCAAGLEEEEKVFSEELPVPEVVAEKSEEDVIVTSGRIYKGNDGKWIMSLDTNTGPLTFTMK